MPSAGRVSSAGQALISLFTRPIVSVVAALPYSEDRTDNDSEACDQHSTSDHRSVEY